MNGLLRLELLLGEITYKPGWTFECSRDYLQNGKISPAACCLKIVYMTQDVNEPEQSTLVSYVREIPLDFLEVMPEEDIIAWIRNAIQEAEDHEMNEWLKFKGLCVRDPHPRAPSL